MAAERLLASSRSQEAQRIGSIIRVVYLDDEEMLLDIGKMFLEREGDFEVHTTGSPEEALRFVLEHRVDAVLSDYQMPILNGIQFLKQIRVIDADIPFIIFTGRGREEVVIEALNNGADFYLQKGAEPVTQFAELANAFRKLVDRNRSEQRLRRTESLLVTVAKHVKDVIFRVSLEPKFTVDYISPAIFHLTGVPQNSFYLNPHLMLEMVHPDDRHMMEHWMQGLSIAGDHMLRWVTPEGRVLWMEQSNFPLVDSTGKAYAFEGIARDMTGHVETESQLRSSEERYRLIADNTADLVLITDKDLKPMYISPSVRRVLGHDADRLGYDHTLDLILEGSMQEVQDTIQILVRNHSNHGSSGPRHADVDLRVVDAWGKEHDIQMTCTALRQEDGALKGIMFVGRDMTIKTQALRTVQEEERFLEDVLGSIQDGISVLDKDLNVVRVNPTMEHLFPDMLPLVGKKCHQAYHLSDIPCRVCPSLRCMNSGRPESEVVQHRNANGEAAGWLEVHSFPYTDSVSGQVVGCIEYVRDITDRIRAEESLNHAQAKIEILNTITRHDIMNQLMVLKGNLMLWRMNDKDFDHSRYAEAMHRSADAIERQVRFAKDYQNLGSRELVWQSVEEVFRRSIETLPLAGVTMSLKVKGLHLRADRMIERVFYNLVDNTLEHGGSVKNIQLSAQREGEELHLIYEDDGKGVEEERKKGIFEIVHGEEAGLGLFLCRSILELSGIHIEECGTPGDGARFVMHVPRESYQYNH